MPKVFPLAFGCPRLWVPRPPTALDARCLSINQLVSQTWATFKLFLKLILVTVEASVGALNTQIR